MKKICILFFLTFTFLIYSNSDNEQYLSYFASDNYNEHIKGIDLIKAKADSLKNNKELIEQLFTENLYDGKTQKLSEASSENYVELRTKAIKTIGMIGSTEHTDKILSILKNSQNNKIKEACIFSLGEIGDNDDYETTTALYRYYNSLNLETIKNENNFCTTSVECFYKLSQYKTLEIIEHTGLINLFKIFMQKEIFSEEIYNFSKKKLLDIMIKNS